MNNKKSEQGKPLALAAAWLAACVVLLLAVCSTPVYAETKTVVTEGATSTCFGTRDFALNLARTAATNDAHEECHALGPGWSYTANQFPGYEQCKSCGSNGFTCNVKQAVYICTNMQKEREEKAAKARAEKEAKAKEAKDKSEREKAERAVQQKAAKEKAAQERAEQTAKSAAEQAGKKKLPAAQSNSIDDAFSKMEKQTGKMPTAKTGNIDAEFEKMAAYRVEQERLRLVALKARQEREARELAQKKQRDEAMQFCQNAIESANSCLVSACKSEPSKTTCTDRREDESPPCKGGPGTRCMVFPKYTCYASAPNPAHTEWESCKKNAENKCTSGGVRFTDIDECVRQRERLAR